jgi:hypothetical protein
MNNRIAVVVLATIVASPALAQSNDPPLERGILIGPSYQPRSATVSRERPIYLKSAITRRHKIGN